MLFFHENGMLFLLDDHALRVSLNLFLVVVTGGKQQRITTAAELDSRRRRSVPVGDVSGARRGHGDAVPSVRPCNI